ncbi:hypothetical protein F0241_19070 [Vibrio kanaloae]|uniref:Uncharacterized protein n=1 Tax=Vibrio kanaloae TaxID=170673 RepID=A0A4U1X774_9VIBR|nr:hypothetical protein F7Q89_16170 [Vibrio kanaloae]NOI03196.1 hypothetical protein [Vibrio kanaloae]NOJ02019.1 hypothetical protein [Vibrio kanaloae]TKE97802.1 hypothetical protein FCV44_08620 [Vibrio kanaloae]TKF02490.1 hypothetical protein FCV46_15520 [Vibrio kanaloae]
MKQENHVLQHIYRCWHDENIDNENHTQQAVNTRLVGGTLSIVHCRDCSHITYKFYASICITDLKTQIHQLFKDHPLLH